MNRVKKRNFTESELEILLHEVEMRKHMLFGTLSTGINAKQKRNEWERVCEAVNAVGSQQRTHSEIKKKWSDLKVADHPQGKYAEVINAVIILVIQLAACNTHKSCVKMPGY
jgi:hypothetical protein